jgi:hypothetical protein
MQACSGRLWNQPRLQNLKTHRVFVGTLDFLKTSLIYLTKHEKSDFFCLVENLKRGREGNKYLIFLKYFLCWNVLKLYFLIFKKLFLSSVH